MLKRILLNMFFVLALLVVNISRVSAAGNPMKLVGALNPWKNVQFSNVAADAIRHVAYLGSYDDQGVAVIDTTDLTHPILTAILSTHITSDALTSDSADLDLAGRYLAVNHQARSADGAFAGTGNCCGHYAAATPSGNWVYLEDEIGIGGTGGVHVLDTHTCDGTSYCTPQQVGFWHINSHPVQAAAFYLPNANKNLACNQACFFQGRETWGAYLGSDGRIYASDFWLGFFIVQLPD